MALNWKVAFRRRLVAATLVEVVVALLILALVWIMSIQLLLQLEKKGMRAAALRASIRVDQEAIKTKTAKEYYSKRWSDESFTYVRQVGPYRGESSLWLLRLSALNQAGDTLATHQSVVYEAD